MDQFQHPESIVAHRRVVFRSLGIAVAAGLLVLFMFAPRFSLWRAVLLDHRLPFPETHRARDALAQLQDPWVQSDSPSNAVLSWRLLFPLVWHYGKLPPLAYLAMPFLGCVLTLWLAAWLSLRRFGDWRRTWMATALFAALPWFFVSTGWLAYFDSWLMLGMLVAAFIPSRVALALVCLSMPWIDERFLLALPVVVPVRMIALGRIEQGAWRGLLADLAVIVAASCPYLGIRAAIWLRGDPGSSGYVRQYWAEMLTVPLPRFLVGLWSGYRAAWLMIGAAICFVAQRLGWRWAGPLAVLVIVSAVGSLLVAADMSRSLSIEAPVMLLGAWLWCEDKKPGARYALPVVLAANLLLPASHVIWHFSVDLRYLYTEIDNLQKPPRELQPDTYFGMAKELREGGDLAGAEWAYDVAIRLDDKFAQAYAGRASLRLQKGNVDAGLADLETALQLKPDLADALLMRAAVYRSRGQTSAAIEDLRKALAGAPTDWPLREETQEFLDLLLRTAAPPKPVP